MSIALVCPDKDPQPWLDAFMKADPGLRVQVWPELEDPHSVDMSLCWNQPADALRLFSGLKCISSMGAGVDALLKDGTLPVGVPVVRLVDPLLKQQMGQYILTQSVWFCQKMDLFARQQSEGLWVQQGVSDWTDCRVGLMGYGELGRHCARVLKSVGLQVKAWARSTQQDTEVPVYTGQTGLSAFLSDLDVLVCLLPLTTQTQRILNQAVFDCLPAGACLINAGRGGHLNETDLLAALDKGQLRAACLDVFECEPLPAQHPFWSRRDVWITPHNASLTRPDSVVPQILENLRRVQAGLPLLNQVDRLKGY